MKFISLILLVFISSSCSDLFESNPIKTVDIYKGEYKKFMEASKNEDANEMKRIFDNKHLELDHTDSIYGLSLLNWCIFNNKEKSFETLLQLGANPNLQDSSGKFAPPITEAAQLNYTTEFLKLALQYNGDYNLLSKKIEGISNQTPLLGAIYSKRMSSVKLLVEKGANVNLTQDSLWTPLAETIIQDKMEMTMYLLENGADYKNLRFRTISVLKNQEGDVVLDSNGSPIMHFEREMNILDLLRNIQFPLNSKEYEIKMKVVDFLKNRGLDYWIYPIPEKIKKEHQNDMNYLSNY